MLVAKPRIGYKNSRNKKSPRDHSQGLLCLYRLAACLDQDVPLITIKIKISLLALMDDIEIITVAVDGRVTKTNLVKVASVANDVTNLVGHCRPLSVRRLC